MQIADHCVDAIPVGRKAKELSALKLKKKGVFPPFLFCATFLFGAEREPRAKARDD